MAFECKHTTTFADGVWRCIKKTKHGRFEHVVDFFPKKSVQETANSSNNSSNKS